MKKLVFKGEDMRTVYQTFRRKVEPRTTIWTCRDADEPSEDDGFCGKRFRIVDDGSLFDGDVSCPYCGADIDVT